MSDLDAIGAYLRLLGHPIVVVAQRPVRDGLPEKQFIWPVDLVEPVEQIAGLAEDYNRVFCNLNPLKERYLDVRPANGTSVRDVMIERRTRLLVDVDAHGTSLEEAEQQKEAIKRFLGWAPLLECYSGNGFGLIYPIDMANATYSRDLIKDFLQSLHQDFSCVDTSVTNAGRLTRIAGTMNVRDGQRVTTRILNNGTSGELAGENVASAA